MQSLALESQAEHPTPRVLKRLVLPIGIAYLLLPLTFLLPRLDSTRAPYFNLESDVAGIAWLLSATGTLPWILPVVAVLLVLLVSRPSVAARRRILESCAVIGVTGLIAGGGAWLNEHVLKEELAVPRPNIIDLATAGALRLPADQFYALGDKDARSDRLDDVLTPGILPEMSAQVREHWIDETGYSRPSGHSFAAMFFCTFFLALAIAFVRGKRLWVFYLLPVWAVLVCYSRLVLRVHSPTDIVVGGLQGIVLGVIAFLLVRHLLVGVFARVY